MHVTQKRECMYTQREASGCFALSFFSNVKSKVKRRECTAVVLIISLHSYKVSMDINNVRKLAHPINEKSNQPPNELTSVTN